MLEEKEIDTNAIAGLLNQLTEATDGKNALIEKIVEAFEPAIAQHAQKSSRLCSRIKNYRIEPSDLSQEARLNLLTELNKKKPNTDFRYYMSVIRNSIAQHNRHITKDSRRRTRPKPKAAERILTKHRAHGECGDALGTEADPLENVLLNDIIDAIRAKATLEFRNQSDSSIKEAILTILDNANLDPDSVRVKPDGIDEHIWNEAKKFINSQAKKIRLQQAFDR